MKHLLSSIYGPVRMCAALSWFRPAPPCPQPSHPLGVRTPSAALALCSATPHPLLHATPPRPLRACAPSATLTHCRPLPLLWLGSAPPHLHTLRTCGVMACLVEVVAVAVAHVDAAGVAVARIEEVGVAVAGVSRRRL